MKSGWSWENGDGEVKGITDHGLLFIKNVIKSQNSRSKGFKITFRRKSSNPAYGVGAPFWA
jgi:hypothetical protein